MEEDPTDTYIAGNRGCIEALLSAALNALCIEKPLDPLAFLARHFTTAVARVKAPAPPVQEATAITRMAPTATAAASLTERIDAWRASASAKDYLTSAAAMGDDEELNNRFAAGAGTLTFSYGDVAQFFAGLEGLVGLPFADFMLGMLLEHASDTPFHAWNSDERRETTPRAEYAYVTEKLAGDPSVPTRIADMTGRAGAALGQPGWLLRAFANLPEARAAGLLLAEVAGARLYTGPMYVCYNNVLRARTRGKYVTTLHAINSAVIKLSKLTKAWCPPPPLPLPSPPPLPLPSPPPSPPPLPLPSTTLHLNPVPHLTLYPIPTPQHCLPRRERRRAPQQVLG
jgi:hypothetical protein